MSGDSALSPAAPVPPQAPFLGRHLAGVVGLLVLVKLLWFDAQIDVRISPVGLWAATGGTAMVVAAIIGLTRPSRRVAVAVIVNGLITLVLWADLLYYRFFFQLITLGLVGQAGQGVDAWRSVVALLEPTDLLLAVDLLIVPLAVRRRLPPRNPRTHERAWFRLLLGLAIAAGPSLGQARSGDAFDGWSDFAAYRTTGLVGFHLYDVGRGLRESIRTEQLTARQYAEVVARLKSADPAAARLEGAPPRGAFAGANVLVIQVEALQDVVLNRSVAGRPITPHLNRFAAESIRFTDFFHQTAAGHTADAEWLAGCSLLPARRGTAFQRFSGNDLDCLPEKLRRLGYSTSAHHANNPAFWNRGTMYPAMGYQRFFSEADFSGRRLGWGVEDGAFLEQVPGQFGAQPFYSLAVTLSSHHPYGSAELAEVFDAGPLEGRMLGDYVKAIHFTDSALGEFFEQLKASGVWDDTIILLYGDHDSGVYDEESFDALVGRPLSELERETVFRQVPLLVHVPDSAYAGLTVDQPAGEWDIAPMIAGLLGMPASESSTFLGEDPLSRRSRPVPFAVQGFVTRDLASFTPAGECWDRSSGQAVATQRCALDAASSATDREVSLLVAEFDLLPRLVEEVGAGGRP